MGRAPARRPVSALERLENSKLGIAVVLAIVIVVILAAIFLVVRRGADDAYLSATLYHRYDGASGTTGPHVHVWGDVYNWGESEGSSKITIVITDDEGHGLEDTFKVGPVSPHGSVEIDKSYPWDYVYDSAEHPVAPVEVSYTM